MDAKVMSYRRGRRTQNTYQMIIQPAESKNKDDAEKLIGKKVIWTTASGKEMEGTISKPHGGNGAVLAQFVPGLPGQSIGTDAKIQ